MLNYLLYRVGQLIALSLPLNLCYKIATLISDLHYSFAFQDRRIMRDNLKSVFPEFSKRKIRQVCINTFRNFARYLVDFFRAEKIDQDFVRNKVTVKDKQYVDLALKNKKGVIILSAHLGNWELGGMIVSLLGYDFWAVAMPHKDSKVNTFFNFQRERNGVKVIALGHAVRKCLSVLKENKLLALVGDRDFSQKGKIVDFFGKPTVFPKGPAEFSRKTGAVIVPVFMLRNHDQTFTLKFEKPLEHICTEDKEKDLLRIIDQYKVIFEDYIRHYPDQWSMFRRFWTSN